MTTLSDIVMRLSMDIGQSIGTSEYGGYTEAISIVRMLRLDEEDEDETN